MSEREKGVVEDVTLFSVYDMQAVTFEAAWNDVFSVSDSVSTTDSALTYEVGGSAQRVEELVVRLM